jgi:hypothetical protein
VNTDVIDITITIEKIDIATINSINVKPALLFADSSRAFLFL